MESNNTPVVPKKKLGKVIRIVLLMLRKKISKNKLLQDLHHLMSKRGKMFEKLIASLTFHHHHQSTFVASNDYEFSCSNSPAVAPFSFNHKRRKHYDLPSPSHEITTVAALHTILEMLNYEGDITETASSSPVLPGFGYGHSPMVRQLRITDSPFPLKDDDHMNCEVDKQADEFIERFYDQLRLQKKINSR